MESEYINKKKDELVAICKERHLPYSGTKAVLVARILGLSAPSKEIKTIKNKIQRPPPPPPKCFGLIETKYIHAKKNSFGNYEDPISRLCFDPTTHQVIGKQGDGEILKLNMEDVAYCQERGLIYSQDIVDKSFTTRNEDVETTIERLIKEAGEDDCVSDDEETDTE